MPTEATMATANSLWERVERCGSHRPFASPLPSMPLERRQFLIMPSVREHRSTMDYPVDSLQTPRTRYAI